MRNSIIIFILIILCFSQSNAQTIEYSREIKTILAKLDSMSADSTLEFKYIGEGSRPSDRYKVYELLTKVASDEELIQLIKTPGNSAVRGYAYMALIKKYKKDIGFQNQIKGIDFKIKTFSGCIVSATTFTDFKNDLKSKRWQYILAAEEKRAIKEENKIRQEQGILLRDTTQSAGMMDSKVAPVSSSQYNSDTISRYLPVTWEYDTSMISQEEIIAKTKDNKTFIYIRGNTASIATKTRKGWLTWDIFDKPYAESLWGPGVHLENFKVQFDSVSPFNNSEYISFGWSQETIGNRISTMIKGLQVYNINDFSCTLDILTSYNQYISGAGTESGTPNISDCSRKVSIQKHFINIEKAICTPEMEGEEMSKEMVKINPGNYYLINGGLIRKK